jgi:hypothetical protein
MDNTWSNTPGSPNYEYSIEEIMEEEFGIDIREYYSNQNKCYNKTAIKKTA